MPRTTKTRTGTTARKKTAARTKAKTASRKKAPARKKTPVKKKAPARKAPAKKSPVKKKVPAKKKAPAKKAPTKKKAAAKKAPTKKKVPAKKTPAKKAAAKKSARVKRRASGPEFQNFEPYRAKRGEEYMNDAQRNHFREMLLNWKSELMHEVDRTVNHMKDEAANFPDPADRATQEEEFSLELRTRDRERKLIKKIDATMELIDQNDYGYCEACGVEIGIQRLEARPTATQCIDCKTLAEIKEKQELG